MSKTMVTNNKLAKLFDLLGMISAKDIEQYIKDCNKEAELNGGVTQYRNGEQQAERLRDFANKVYNVAQIVAKDNLIKSLKESSKPVEVLPPVAPQQSFKSNYLKVSDLVELFGVTKQTVSNWIKDGKIKPVTVGGGIRFTQKEVDRFTKDRK